MASEDADFFIVCMSFQRLIPSSIFLKCGTQTRVQYMNMTSIVKAIGENLCGSLLGMHAFNVCAVMAAVTFLVLSNFVLILLNGTILAS